MAAATLVPVGERWSSEPCPRCACTASGIVARHLSATEWIDPWDSPDANCSCDCHDTWRFIHGVPRPVGEVAA